MAHTPGPWIYNGCFITADGERPIARGDVPPEENECNAHLIAAAPELLEACRAVIAFRDLDAEQRDDAVHMCEVAIAKATGKEP